MDYLKLLEQSPFRGQTVDQSVVKEVVRTLLRVNVCARCILRCVNCCKPSDLKSRVLLRDLHLWSMGSHGEEGKNEDRGVAIPEFTCSICFGLLQLDTGASFKELAVNISMKGKREEEGTNHNTNSNSKSNSNSKNQNPLRCTFESDFYDQVTEKTVNAMEGDGFSCKETNFTLFQFMPVEMLVRELSLFYWLSEKFPDVSFKHLIDGADHPGARQVCKGIFQQTFSGALNSKNVTNSEEQSGELGIQIKFLAGGIDEKEIKDIDNETKAFTTGKGQRKRKRGDKSKSSFGERSPAAFFKAVLKIKKELFSSIAPHPDRDHWVVSKPGMLHISYYRHPIYVAGKYIKKNRALSQSSWFVDSERIGESSVEELMMSTFNALEQADEYKMIPAGREDLDVRMLGKGRPFVMEIKNCRKKFLPLEKLQDETFTSKFLKDDLGLEDVYTTDKSALNLLKEGAEEKTKTYKAVIWLSSPLTDQDIEKVNSHFNLTVHQKTPLRVLHRRAGLVRDKIIHKMNIKGIPGNRHFATIELHTQAGTYIKEFVHGDFGRTNPSLSSVLGYQVDIVQLDVTSVEMDFSPIKVEHNK